MNMLATIVPKSDQINADDLIGKTLTITVTEVQIKPGEQPVSIFYEGGKPYRPGKSMCRVLVAGWGPDANAYVGRSMTLYRDPKVKWGGLEVGGIRISHMSHLEKGMTMALTETKGVKKPHVVKPLVMPSADAPVGRKDPWRAWLDKAVQAINAAEDMSAYFAAVDKTTAKRDELRAHSNDMDRELAAVMKAKSEALRGDGASAAPEPEPQDDATEDTQEAA